MVLAAGAVGATGTFAWFQVSAATISGGSAGPTNVSIAANPYSMSDTFSVVPIFGTIANDVEMTDTAGKATYYVNYNASATDSGLVTKFAAEKPSAEVAMTWKITYSGSLTDSEANAAWATAYAAESKRTVTITITKSDRVKIGSTSERAVAANSDDNTSGVALEFTTKLPSTISLSTGETSAYGAGDSKSFWFGIVGQNGLDTTGNYGTLTATVTLS